MNTKRLRKKLTTPRTPDGFGDAVFLSTGSTLLNLAISDRARGGFCTGKFFYLVGDSASGKTFLSMTCFVEATKNPAFKDHRLILNNAEDGALMDVRKFFGADVKRRLEWRRSEAIEEFYDDCDQTF